MTLAYFVFVALALVVGYLLVVWLEKKMVKWVIEDKRKPDDANSRLYVLASLAAIGIISVVSFLVKALVWIF